VIVESNIWEFLIGFKFFEPKMDRDGFCMPSLS
jgi:hypothetical protein